MRQAPRATRRLRVAAMLAALATCLVACGDGGDVTAASAGPGGHTDPPPSAARDPAPRTGTVPRSPDGRPPRPGDVAGAPAATPSETAAAPPTPSPRATAPVAGVSPPAEPDPPAPSAAARPPWLGRRPLPTRPDGFGQVLDSPPELEDRRLPPPEPPLLEPPSGEAFAATVDEVPEDVLARSTWSPSCPVAAEELRYLTVTFWGFDGAAHTGELLVHASAAADLVEVFRRLHEARFPIEEMRVVAPEELDAEPTGDGNNTTAFVCRPAVGSASWSQHAYGLAVDVNPFHNPYVRGDLVLPELASAYVDRSHHRPGMIQPGDAVTGAFAAIGWGWGGDWRSSRDWMHFSATGR